MPAPQIVVFTKPGCHLCDDMLDLLRAALTGTAATLTERNIARDLADFERYKHDIPVLVIDGREIARHRITASALQQALQAFGLGREQP